MNYSVCVLIVYLYNDLYCRLQTFPCDFNVYEETKDGLITITEFSNYTKKHGYDVERVNSFSVHWIQIVIIYMRKIFLTMRKKSV